MKKYNKIIKIKNKIITLADIDHIASIVESQFMDDDYKQDFSVSFTDSSSIDDNSKELFKTMAFERRQTKRIHIDYRAKKGNKIEITIGSSLYWIDSEIIISSEDEQWYQGMVSRLSDIVNEMKKQANFAPLFHPSISFAWGLGISFLLTIFFINCLKNSLTNTGILLPEWLSYAIMLGVLALNFILAFFAANCVAKGYPTVDLMWNNEGSSIKNKKIIQWTIGAFAPSFVMFIIEKLIKLFFVK